MAETTLLAAAAAAAEISDSSDHRENQVSFVMDLFPHSFEHQSHSYVSPIDDPTLNLDLGLGLGFPTESTRLSDFDVDVADISSGFLPSHCVHQFFLDCVHESSNIPFVPLDAVFDKDAQSAICVGSSPALEDEIGGDVMMDDLFGWEDSFEVTHERFVEEMGVEEPSYFDWELPLVFPFPDPMLDGDFEMPAWQGPEESRNLCASRSAVENMTSVVVVTEGEVDGGDATCAICKEDMVVGEKAKALPCSHRFHWCCIDPWLGMRNTCPVCRYELPTDDPEYERRRIERGLRR